VSEWTGVRMNCPSCGAELAEKGIDLDAGTAQCFECGHVAKLSVGPSEYVEPRVEKPANARAVVDGSRPGQIALYVPGGGGCFFLFFAAFWLAITAAVTVGAVASKESFSILFMVPFWVVGIGVLLMGLFIRFGVTGVYIDREQFIVTKTLWGKGWTRRGLSREISSIRLAEAYKQNERPVMAVQIAVGQKTYTFGSFLKDDEKAWLVSELRVFMAELGRALPP